MNEGTITYSIFIMLIMNIINNEFYVRGMYFFLLLFQIQVSKAIC